MVDSASALAEGSTTPSGLVRRSQSRSLRLRAIVAAVCGAILGLVPEARAQVFTERLRIQGGYITEQRPPPQPRLNDFWIGAVPELSVAWMKRNVLATLSYQLTGALHTLGGASELANRVVFASQIDASPRTTLLLSAEAAQTTFSNLLFSRSPTENTVALAPSPATRTVSARVSEGLSYELSPRLLFSQFADVGVVTTLPPAPPLDTLVANVSTGIDYLFPRDALGIEARASYANAQALPPTPDQEFVLMTAAPRWRHDWSRTLSTMLSGGATLLVSPNQDTDPTVAPFVRAAALYTHDLSTSVDLAYLKGVVPSALTGQIFESDQVTLHGFTMLSEHHRVSLSGSIGYINGRFVDLLGLGNDLSFESVLSDVDVTWQPTRSGLVQLFARYLVQVQVGDVDRFGINPSFIRDAILVGVQLSTRPPIGGQGGGGSVYGDTVVPRSFPQRVDGADGMGTNITDTAPEEEEETSQPAPARRPSRRIDVAPPRPPTPPTSPEPPTTPDAEN